MENRFILFFILLCCSAFFSSSEISLFSLSRIQIHKFSISRKRSSHEVVKCLKKPREWLATILLGNELVNVLISIIGASIVNHYFLYGVKWQMIISVVLVTPIVLIFGEIIPKNLAIRFSVILAPIFVVPLGVIHRFFKPFRWLLTKSADRVVTLLGGNPEKFQPMIMEEEFRRLVDLGSREGVIVEEEREIIHNVFDFSDKTIETIITPASKIFALPIEKPYDEMLKEIKETQFSRIPIYEGNINNIIGILHIRDLFSFHRKRQSGGDQNVRSVLRKPLFIEPNKKLENVLKDFQSQGMLMAIVKDDHTVFGLVTMDDLLEEIFGEIER